MIKIEGVGNEHVVEPTIFPDGTSQVWHLPAWVFKPGALQVTWWFEAERELVDLMSLFALFLDPRSVHLHIPYLPYARQDKGVSNNTTFNLHVLMSILRLIDCGPITTVDAHSDVSLSTPRLRWLPVTEFHHRVVDVCGPQFIVYPDRSARLRYSRVPFEGMPWICCDKSRDPATGEITNHTMTLQYPLESMVVGVDLTRFAKAGDRFLIVDDICDGGATFISVAKLIKDQVPGVHVTLCVTHGLFSKGKDHLLANGIDDIVCTDSLLRNKGSYHV